MKVDVLMPEMGESIAEGTVAKWLRKPGDKVERDDALLEITTDKVDSEIPSPESGVLAEILVGEGETVDVGTPLGRIDSSGEEAIPAAVEELPQQKGESAKPALSPVARNIAEKEGLTETELRGIEGTGRGGKLTKDDILQFLEQRGVYQEVKRPDSGRRVTVSPEDSVTATEGQVEIIDMSTIRKTIADRMVQSKHVSPHTYTAAEVDMNRIVEFRERIKARFEREQGFKLTYTHFVLHATVLALKALPMINSSLEDDKIVLKKYVNLGVAVALESGLIVPVIKQADEKNLLGLARSASELAERAVHKELKPEDVQGGTFTVTNPGVYGNIFGFPIINQPQLAILGVGAIKKRPVVVDDAIAIRSVMYISLSYDHRVIDGSLSARFLQRIRSILENYDTENAI
jgi:2-oxoglutarate dehydrogenase E2 component (dihydrolipoamide succinyltransferase)